MVKQRYCKRCKKLFDLEKGVKNAFYCKECTRRSGTRGHSSKSKWLLYLEKNGLVGVDLKSYKAVIKC